MQVSRSICTSDVSVDEHLLTITTALAYRYLSNQSSIVMAVSYITLTSKEV